MIQKRQQLYRNLTRMGYFGLMIHLVLWLGWLAPSELLPIPVTLMIALAPLLLPLRGILHGTPYTHAWAGFIALIYLLHGMVEFWSNPPERIYAGIEFAFAFLFFYSTALYARLASKFPKSEPSNHSPSSSR